MFHVYLDHNIHEARRDLDSAMDLAMTQSMNCFYRNKFIRVMDYKTEEVFAIFHRGQKFAPIHEVV